MKNQSYGIYRYLLFIKLKTLLLLLFYEKPLGT